jgi:hypothetical protein
MEKKELKKRLDRFIKDKGLVVEVKRPTVKTEKPEPSKWYELNETIEIEFKSKRLLTFIEQELDKAREEGFVSGYVEANGDCNMLLKWKSYKQPKRTQVQAIKTTEEKQEKYLKKYIKLKQ